ncbi:DUF1737 domain-containing protein [Flavobacterium sp. W20_MBD1_R3]|uniref:DUF1737 domain-containing protein n=1 Tax=Flavobacterium sp. W20_MBD1_R3 TaxID=3240278 RepID=UPI003F9057C8
MEYKVVESWDVMIFEKEINKLLQQNWELLGGVCASYDRGNSKFQYTQAMIKKIK